MLPTFDDIQPLTEYEQKTLLPLFLKGFRKKIGPENAITNFQIRVKLAEKGIDLSGARVRKIINYIRVNDLVPGLVASSKGYYISKNPKEIEEYIKSLSGRIEAIMTVRNKFIQYKQFFLSAKP